MAYEHILVDKEEGVAIITLNRPDRPTTGEWIRRRVER